jgi:hypothetical protein
MSVGGWLKAHRKRVIAHALIVAAFVLLTIFILEPLFERLQAL